MTKIANNYFSSRKNLEQQKCRASKNKMSGIDRNVILQYALFNLEILPEPNLEIALKWQLIGAALDIDGAAEARDETAAELTQDTILEVQKETTTMFQTDDLATRFAVQPASDP